MHYILCIGHKCSEGKMNEKRKHKRLNLFAFEGSDLFKSLTSEQKISGITDDAIPLSLFLLTDRTTGEVTGHLVDISLGGIMIIGERPIEKGRLYTLSMDVSLLADDDRVIVFDAKCAWVGSEVDSNFYIAGFEFINISEDNRAVVNEIMGRISPIAPEMP